VGCRSILLNYANAVTISANSIYGTPANGIQVTGNTTLCSDITVSDNIVKGGPTTFGIYVGDCLQVTVTGNALSSASSLVGTAIAVTQSGNNVIVDSNVIIRFQRGVRYTTTAGPTVSIVGNIAAGTAAPYVLDQTPFLLQNNIGAGSSSNELYSGAGQPFRSASVSAGALVVKGATLLNVDGTSSPSIKSLTSGVPQQVVTIRNSATSGTISITNSTTLILNNAASLSLVPGQLARFLCSNNVAPLVWYQI